MPDDLAKALRLTIEVAQASATEHIGMEPGIPGAVLRAVATMARSSKRHQAELGVALRRAGLMLSNDVQRAALRQLCEVASVADVIELDDGGILLSVTSAGMERAYR